MKTQRAGDLYALACALTCGLGNIPAKAALTNITTEIFNFYFFLFAFVISGFTLCKKQGRDEIVKINFKTLRLIFLLAIVFSLALYFFMTSLKLIEPATVSFLSRFEVIFIVVLAYMILKEKLRFIEMIGGGVALAGIFVLKYKTTVIISHAATLMVLSSFFFAIAEIIIKKNISRLGTAQFVFYRNLFMAIFFFLFMLIRGQELYLPNLDILSLILIASLLLPVFGRVTYLEALKRINISRAALISQSSPLFTAFFAFMILHTYPAPIEWLGGALIIAGVIVVKLSEKKLSIGKQ